MEKSDTQKLKSVTIKFGVLVGIITDESQVNSFLFRTPDLVDTTSEHRLGLLTQYCSTESTHSHF